MILIKTFQWVFSAIAVACCPAFFFEVIYMVDKKIPLKVCYQYLGYTLAIFLLASMMNLALLRIRKKMRQQISK